MATPSPGLLWRTVRPIGLRRTLHRLLRPVRGLDRRIGHRLGRSPATRVRTEVRLESDGVDGHWDGNGRFSFLGVERDLGFPPDWQAAPSRLWGYHLHYLDELRDRRFDAPTRARLLDAWVRGNRFGTSPGWEPFPTSLRLVNALEFLASAPTAPDGTVAGSLGTQAWWLEGNLERDLGANHLWKNLLALCWAGRFLEGGAALRWKRVGDRGAKRELAAQVLPDGFHYERTPGYHAILVDDLLRLSALLDAAGESATEFAEQVRETLADTASALASVLHADGEIPLFNDSVLGQAVPASPLLDRVRAHLARHDLRLWACPEGATDAGLHRLDDAPWRMILDAGDTACDEQPGHAHADTLSYELSGEGCRVVVDAGVFGYAPGPDRRYARSTAAHNTVVVDGADQSEMWGSFRVGRRARVRIVRRGREVAGETIEAAHDGYERLHGRPIHRRTVASLGEGRWTVRDEISGSGEHTATGRVRLHPDLNVAIRRDGAVEAVGESVRCVVRPGSDTTLRLEDGWYFPRFGEKYRCKVVRMDASGRIPLGFSYRLELSRRD